MSFGASRPTGQKGQAMPLYEFRCTKCGKEFEKLQKMSDPFPPCVECASDTEKLISACNHELKGTGWYKTDFKNK